MHEQLSTQRKYPESVQPGIPKLKSLKPGWQRRKIGELLKEVSRSICMDDSANYNLVTVKRAHGGVVKRDTKKGREIAVKSQFVVHAGDFLISKRQIVHGACGIVPDGLDGSIVSNEYSVLNCTDLLDSGFLNYLTYTSYFQQTCFHSSIGVHIEKMIFKLDDWFNWKIDIPALPEQQKIAAFLGAVDQKIEALRRKRELLQSYKRGMLQKIFSQELRFKADDGTEFPEWVEREFDTLAHRVADKLSPNDTNEMLPCIELDSLESSSGKLLTTYKFASQTSLKGQFRAYDVLFGKLRPYLKKFYMPAFSGVCSSEIWILRGSAVIQVFLYYLVQTSKFDWACNKSSGSKMPRADWDFVGKTPFLVPKSKSEQQKIADFLSAIDAKIDAVAGQIAKMEQFKKGLLQQLFI